MSAQTWLVAGLGNPGAGYAHNRHNVGFMVADALAREVGANFGTRLKHSALVAQSALGAGGPAVVIAKPQTFMNESGRAIGALANYFSVPAERIIVVHDELDIPFDSVRLKRGGGHAGHNGLRSIQAHLGTADFLRVRVGIGRPPGQMDPAAFVLRDFAGSEKSTVPVLIAEAVEATLAIIDDGLTAAQQRYHGPA